MKQLKSTFIALPKKSDALEFEDHHTKSLMRHDKDITGNNYDKCKNK